MVTFTTIFLFLTALKTSISVECDYGTARPNFQKSVYDFTLELVTRIEKETDSHFVTSALSPWTLLLVMSLGGSNTTRKQIREVLQLHPNSCIVYLYLELVNQVTMNPDNPYSSKFERSTTIFFNASEKTNQSFFDVLVMGGIYSSRIMYFVDRNETARSINKHVESFTDGFIKKTVTPDDLGGISTLTIDALTYKGAWEVPFPFEDTATDVFYDDEGNPIGHVSLMYGCAKYKVILVPQINATVLELPYYGEDSRNSLLIFLPEQNVSLATMMDLMKDINISTIFKFYERTRRKTVTVQIPRFKISSIFSDWRDIFRSLDIDALFEEQEAKFPGVSYNQFLTNFIQKAELEVNEEGLEIGRATFTLMQSRFMYDDFVANKPFMFMIADRIQHVPILIGAYSKPSIY